MKQQVSEASGILWCRGLVAPWSVDCGLYRKMFFLTLMLYALVGRQNVASVYFVVQELGPRRLQTRDVHCRHLLSMQIL